MGKETTPPAQRSPRSGTPDSAGSAARADWTAWTVCAVAMAATLVLVVTLFHAWQLPRWSAWAAGIVAGLAVFKELLLLSRRRRGGFYVAATAVTLAAGGASVLVNRYPGPAGVEVGGLGRPLVVREPAAAGDTTAILLGEQLLEGLSMLPGLDVIGADADDRPGLAPSLAPSLSLTLESDGSRTSLSVRLLESDDRVAWVGEQPVAAGEYGASVAQLTRDVAERLGVVVGETVGERIARLGSAPADVRTGYFAVLREWRLRGPELPMPEDALQQLDRVLELQPDFAPARSLAANIALAAQGSIDPSPASDLTDLTGDARANQALAKALALQWQADASAERFAAARELAPSDVWIGLDAALASAWSGECEAAGDAAARAVRLAFANTTAGLEAGWVDFLCGNLPRARALAIAAERAAPADASVQLLLASVYMTSGEPERARAALARFDSLRLNAGPRVALAAYLYSLLDAADDSNRLAGAVLGANSSNAQSIASRGVAELAAGEYLSAVRSLREVRTDPVASADVPLIVGLALNSWMDPELNESPFRDVRERLLLR